MLRIFSIIEDFIIVFLYVFGLELPVIRSSSILLILVLPFRLLCIKNGYNTLSKIVKSRYFVLLVGIYLTITILIVVSVVLHMTFDFSLIKTIINCILHLFIAVMIISLFILKNRGVRYLILMFISLFALQSAIEICAFVNKSVLHFVQQFQSEATIARAALYSGRRGLALAGTVFFGLSSLYGIIFLFLVKEFLTNSRITFIKVLIGCLIVVGAFFSGRTFFIGVAVALSYLFFSKLSGMKKTSTFIKALWYVIIVIIVALLIVPDHYYDQIYNLFLYVFEMFFNLIDYGTLTTTSSTHLTEDMYFPLSLRTILLGDGMYTSPLGGYYMNTDAGYMRNILLFGITGLFLCVFSDIYLLWGTRKLRCDKSIRNFSLWIFVYLCLLHYKGETFAYLITLHTMLFLYYLLYVFSTSNEDKHSDLYIQ